VYIIPGTMRPSLLRQLLKELDALERMPRTIWGTAKFKCLRALINERLEKGNNNYGK